ncbi:hypothetical protein OROHE_017862 [Orobanche hederae]
MVDQKCCLCDGADETLDHLFFACPVTGTIWKNVTKWCVVERKVQSSRQEQVFLLSQCRTKSSTQRMDV